ncbi:MAG: hypothetical protein AB7M12_08790 [Hyphomonadaceae bacterium]
MLSAVLIAQALAAAAPHPSAGLQADAARLQACVAKVDVKPDEAYEDAMAWVNESHVREARVCQALALIALKRIEQGALLLEQLADSADGGQPGQRANTYSQAGNARLLAYQPKEAIEDFGHALKYAPSEADLFIDRARAHAMLGDWRNAEIDLTHALDARPGDVLALRLRAEARLQQNVLDLAEKDAADAVRLAPKDVDALLVQGRVREARRTGKPPA